MGLTRNDGGRDYDWVPLEGARQAGPVVPPRRLLTGVEFTDL